ncbi:DUF2799 domain-containing protein [Vibrio ezurae]|uniref:Lipoprotein n=1 Tax=Vibrio ezurae NBRC 102218 TaxID=1219080 RepID=U3CHR9_9VIBR|nr:DUF2799 domain-containing protein [Vibrio ezurae]GAD80734.1 hypothetical protein VEZ01S_39_00320 [Vibrio ezurae NBRC 102218]
MKGLKLFLLAIIPLLFACASSDEALVAKGDWKGVGYSDAIKGKTQRSYAALNKLGAANVNDYEEGYTLGLKEYCNPNFAYQIGLSGQYYQGICAGTPQAQKFRMEWQRGWNDQD